MNKLILLSSLSVIALLGVGYWSTQSPNSWSLGPELKPASTELSNRAKAENQGKADTFSSNINKQGPKALLNAEAENIKNQNTSDPAHTKQQLTEKELAALLDKRLTPAMKREINSLLNPDNQGYPEQHSESGSYVDLSRRAFSVPVAVIDDNGNTVVTDITQPLPVNEKWIQSQTINLIPLETTALST